MTVVISGLRPPVTGNDDGGDSGLRPPAAGNDSDDDGNSGDSGLRPPVGEWENGIPAVQRRGTAHVQR